MTAAPPDSHDLTARKAAARKAAARKAAFAARKAARAAAPDAANQAAARFLAAVDAAPGEIVAGYRPIRTELDPTPVMVALLARGCRLCVPVITAAAQPLTFRLWTPDAEMTEGAFGADIPVDPTEVAPTLLIAPLLTFDRRPYRLGYGGGFYDRTLEQLRAQRPTRAIGYAYAAQEVDLVPTEPTDQLLDGVVTEQEAIF